MINDENIVVWKSFNNIISSAKNTPANGVLKIAEIAAPAPEAVNNFLRSSERLNKKDSLFDMPPPRKAAGASGPKVVPVPRLIVLAKKFKIVSLNGIFNFIPKVALIISVTPLLLAESGNDLIKIAWISIPSVGIKIIMIGFRKDWKLLSIFWRKILRISTILWNNTTENPTITPINAERIKKDV